MAPANCPLFPLRVELDGVKGDVASKVKHGQEVKGVRRSNEKYPGLEVKVEEKSVFRSK